MMNLSRLPCLIVVAIVLLLVAHGPIAQLAHYHEFADASKLFGLPHAADVLSNVGFGIVAWWGACWLGKAWRKPCFRKSRYGYGLFFVSLFLTAIGSAWYHLAPDDARLVWDRLPIALACAGLLAAVRAETHPRVKPMPDLLFLAAFACLSVVWWRVTGFYGQDDLRPYLLLQGLPLVLIPLWQAIYGAPAADRMSFAIAIGLYIAAKAAEMHDHELLNVTGWLSGHTLKHLLSVAAAGVIATRTAQRARVEALPQAAAIH